MKGSKKGANNRRAIATRKTATRLKTVRGKAATTSKASGELALRPYARLLTMLGDQLIRNERVALVELVKNAYDADASWVKVTFENFDSNFSANANSKIIIEDDGIGMNESVVRNDWANPATPGKLIAKREEARTKGGRVIQGEKGIGRFALLKLGRKIEIKTRAARSNDELAVTLDLSAYNTDFIVRGKPLFLDSLKIDLDHVPEPSIRRHTVTLGAERLIRRAHGTRIEISHLMSTWSRTKVSEVFDDLARLQTNFALAPETRADDPDPFNVYIYRNDRHEAFDEQRRDELAALLRNNSVFKIEGGFDDSSNAFDFKIGKRHMRLPLTSPELKGLAVFKEKFGKRGEVLNERDVECGPFDFAFYVFDFSADAKGKRLLDKEDKKLLKKHRIYLYRDDIRVYPYGDPDDDWLQIDMRRGTVKASEFVSNDAVTGFVTITQEDNPNLRDKTSREGLVDTGHPTEDFRALLQVFLAWVRAYPYKQYRAKIKNHREHEVFQQQRVQEGFNELLALPDLPTPAREKVEETQRHYQIERRYLVARAESTESLAGVGLSVEAGTHDLHLAMHSAVRTLDTLLSAAQRGRELDPAHVARELQAVRGALGFIESQLKDLQLLFKSTKQRRKDLRITEILEKVLRLFRAILERAQIRVDIQEVGDGVLTVKTTDAVLLQLFLNLFDNAVYWLDGEPKNRRIDIVINSDRQQLVFADSGPGISAEDAPYIFEPFYSGKGEEGRGLGLYIARQLLERQDFQIELAPKAERVLKGANFLVSFAAEEDEA